MDEVGNTEMNPELRFRSLTVDVNFTPMSYLTVSPSINAKLDFHNQLNFTIIDKYRITLGGSSYQHSSNLNEVLAVSEPLA